MTIPLTPSGVSLPVNMKIARFHGSARDMASPLTYIWFYRQVRNNGPWDYKQRGRQYEAFGNFHYGAVGRAAGIPEIILLRAAGCAQIKAGNWLPANGVCWRNSPFGDDPNDQRWIKEGIKYAGNVGY